MEDLLATATTAIFDLHNGYPESELASSQGTGFDALATELVATLRGRGIDDEGAWTVPATEGISVSKRQERDAHPINDRALTFSRTQLEVIKRALRSWSELLRSPTGADREHHGNEWADAQVAVCNELLLVKLART